MFGEVGVCAENNAVPSMFVFGIRLSGFSPSKRHPEGEDQD